MRPSKYNHLFPLDQTYTLVFNALRGSFLKLDPNARTLYEQIAKGLPPPLDYIGAEDDLQKMRKTGVLIDDDFDEIQYLKVKNRVSTFGSSTLSITLAPTLNCNFRCSYCYENKSDTRMTPETRKKIIGFVSERLISSRHLDVIWYGGEPLLEKQTVLEMSERLRALCKKHKCKYTSFMITNGYLLDKPLALELREQEVSRLQIALDGPREVHDARRVLANGEGTFERIVKNIIDVADIVPVTVRVNTDKMNAGKVTELLDLLAEHGLQNRVNVHFSPVLNINKACQDVAGHCYTSEEFSALETTLCGQAVAKGFKTIKYPRPVIGGCGSLHLNSFLIDPSGDLYKCWNTIGLKEERIGDMDNPDRFFFCNMKWLAWDPFSYEKCSRCDLLPVCMGGCPYQTLHRNLKEPECKEWRNNLREMLLLYYASHLQQKTCQS